MMKHFVFLVTSGIEARTFIYSGLIDRLLSDHQVSILTRNSKSHCFTDIDSRIKILQVNEEREPPSLGKWRYRARNYHTIWLRKRGFKKWRLYLSNPHNDSHSSFRQKFLYCTSNRFGVWITTYIEKMLALHYGTNPYWENILHELKTTDLITSSYSDPTSSVAIQTAINLGISTHVVTNSWKDVFVNPHLPFLPKNIFVWREDEVEFLRQSNSNCETSHVSAIGSLHLSQFRLTKNIVPQDVFYSTLHLDPNRPIINYTSGTLQTINNEEQIVATIINIIKSLKICPKPQLLIRTNPMDTSSRFEHFIDDDVKLQKPNWEWIPEKGWCCPSAMDAKWWVSTVIYSQFNISVASTVTLEYALMGKPVINICFDNSEAIDSSVSNRRYWDAEYYRDVRQKNLAIPVATPKELQQNLNFLLTGGSYSPQKLPWLFYDSVERILDLLQG